MSDACLVTTASDIARLDGVGLAVRRRTPRNFTIAPTMPGDRKFDMVGAASNGVHGIGVLWGYGSREELRDAGASWCVAQPSELPAVIAQADNDC